MLAAFSSKWASAGSATRNSANALQIAASARNGNEETKRRIPMANVIEIAKASVTAYNDKNWSKAKDTLAPDAVYDEKATHRRIQGAGEIIEAWQGWAKAFPDSKATFVREFASGDTAVLELVWKGVHTGPLQTPTGIIPASNKPIEMPACQVSKVEAGKVKNVSHYFDMLTMLTQIGAAGMDRAA
jgi:steroid delta-isomerase-like uncharacterized protein